MGDPSRGSAEPRAGPGPDERCDPEVVACTRRPGFDFGDAPPYLVAVILFIFAGQLAAGSSGRAFAAAPAVAAMALVLWPLTRRFLRPTRVTADTRAGTITFENCCFRRGLWRVTRPSLVRMPLAEIRGNRLTFSRGSYGFVGNYVVTTWRLTVRTARGTVRLGPGMWNVRQLGEALKRTLPPAPCGTCGYDLRGNVSGRCPECGSKPR
jgi:hypothetical protein